ncbi:MAG TPA: phosphopantetheine-binding protein [Azospirillaceae bacterium]|nr:phosphopantetheine-binding protein [Azospirillaceae bacterium]
MTKTEFLAALDELLELDPGTLTGTEQLDDLDNWDSLAVVSFIALVDERLGLVVAGDALSKAKTVADLLALVDGKIAA